MIDNLIKGDVQYIESWDIDYIIGIDEAGRGTLAGPVVAVALALSADSLKQDFWFSDPYHYIQDSKQVTAKRRQRIYDHIHTQYPIGTGVISAHIIDEMNILEATKLAWNQALDICLLQLPLDARVGILIDGNTLPKGIEYLHKAIIKGDNSHLSIASASICAKVIRDTMMLNYHQQYPEYGFEKHKGYGTAYHMEAIQQHQLSDIHRKTFCKNIKITQK